MEQSESRTASGHMTIIEAVAVSTSILVSVIIGVALYKYCKCGNRNGYQTLSTT